MEVKMMIKRELVKERRVAVAKEGKKVVQVVAKVVKPKLKCLRLKRK